MRARARQTRVTLIEWRNDRTEIEKDTIVAFECMIANRGNWRRGDVEEIPITIGHVEWWLKLTGARRHGRDYARDCLATAARLELIEDTGDVLKPRTQPFEHFGRFIWWRVFAILPLRRLRAARWSGALGALPGCLRGWADRQGLIYHRPKPSKGSVQEAFLITGPP
jgi:hypothetical protein